MHYTRGVHEIFGKLTENVNGTAGTLSGHN